MVVGSLEVFAYETPGHSAGSLTFLIGQAYFVGDLAIAVGPYPVADVDGDVRARDASIRRLRKIVGGGAMIYPGHGFPFNADRLSLITKSSSR